MRLAGINVMPIHIVIAYLLQDRPTSELCAVIAYDAGGFSLDTHKRIQFPRPLAPEIIVSAIHCWQAITKQPAES